MKQFVKNSVSGLSMILLCGGKLDLEKLGSFYKDKEVRLLVKVGLSMISGGLFIIMVPGIVLIALLGFAVFAPPVENNLLSIYAPIAVAGCFLYIAGIWILPRE